MTRALIGVCARNDHNFIAGDLEVIRVGKLEVLKTMTDLLDENYRRARAINPRVQFILRLYVGGRPPSPEEYVARFRDQINRLHREFGLLAVQIHCEPNHAGGIEGYGASEAQAREFRDWYLKVLPLLRAACPGVKFLFPGLAVPDFAHGTFRWLEINRDAIEASDGLGVHCYWQTPHDQPNLHKDRYWGEVYKTVHDLFPNTKLYILEAGNSNGQSGLPVDHPLFARQLAEWFAEVQKHSYVVAACPFISSSPDPQWRRDGFCWTDEDGKLSPIVAAVGAVPRVTQVEEPTVTKRTISPAGEQFIKRWENLRLEVYDDATGEPWTKSQKGFPTVGWGHRCSAAEVQKYKSGITRAQADELFGLDLKFRAESHVQKHVTGPLAQHEHDALVSLTFNIGGEGLRTSDLVKLLNAGDRRAAASEFYRFNLSNKQKMDGLITRRALEARIFAEADYDWKHEAGMGKNTIHTVTFKTQNNADPNANAVLKDCVAASAATLLEWKLAALGTPRTVYVDDVVTFLGAPKPYGYDIDAPIGVASKHYKLTLVHEPRISEARLREILAGGTLVEALVYHGAFPKNWQHPWEKNPDFAHAVVIYGIDDEYVYFLDPAWLEEEQGRCWMPIADFFRAWSAPNKFFKVKCQGLRFPLAAQQPAPQPQPQPAPVVKPIEEEARWWGEEELRALEAGDLARALEIHRTQVMPRLHEMEQQRAA